MDKQEMTRSEDRRARPQNESRPVPGPQDKLTAGAAGIHSKPRAAHDPKRPVSRAERLASRAYSLGDNDLARDNLENDLPDADLQDL